MDTDASISAQTAFCPQFLKDARELATLTGGQYAHCTLTTDTQIAKQYLTEVLHRVLCDSPHAMRGLLKIRGTTTVVDPYCTKYVSHSRPTNHALTTVTTECMEEDIL